MCVGLCFVILSFRVFVFSCFFVRDFYCSFGLFLKACFLVMKAASMCDKHCELHDSVNHLQVERIHLLVRVHVVCLFIFLHFVFRVFFCFVFCRDLRS